MIDHKFTLTIMPDYGYSFAWIKPADDWTSYVGSFTSLSAGDMLDQEGLGIDKVPEWLVAELNAWQMYFETDNPDSKPGNDNFSWELFHVEGLFLAALLQQALQHNGVVVRYVYPCEDTMRRHCDDIVMDNDACVRAKAHYLRVCLPLKDWSFSTLRHTLLATDAPVESSQRVLDKAAIAWGLPPQPLGLANMTGVVEEASPEWGLS